MDEQFLLAEKRGPAFGLGVRVLVAALALQTMFDVDWYDMLSTVSAPAGAAA